MTPDQIKEQAVERIYLFPGEHDGEVTLLWGDDPAPGVSMDPTEAVEYVRKDVHERIIKTQARAATEGMDASRKCSYQQLEEAKRLHAESNPEALESERAANAHLTEQIAKLEAHISSLKDDIEIHRTAEEAQIALRQKADEREAALAAHVEQLRGALRPLAYGGASDCIARGDFSVMRERVKDWLGVRDFKNARTAFDSTPTTSLARRDEESMRKGFWWGFERARMHPDENNIAAEWQSVTALMKSNEEYRQRQQAEGHQ